MLNDVNKSVFTFVKKAELQKKKYVTKSQKIQGEKTKRINKYRPNGFGCFTL